jgi:glycosyltransferase involved in cell wall biosynthesis
MIFIDASRYSNTSQKTGVENYSFFLINELIKLAPEDITLISPRKIDLPVPQIVIPFKRLWTQIRLSWKLFLNKKIDNLFVPSHLMPIVHPKNTTITIHDVAFKRFPESYGRLSRCYLDWGTKYAVKHAKKIIVPSDTTKKDLVDYYKADHKKITVIPLGYKEIPRTDDKFCASRLKHYGLKPQHYFLFIGRIETKKNVQTLVKAFEKITNEYPHIKLVLAGKTGVGGTEILKSTKSKNIIVTGYITEADKQALLKNCLCFVFPSIFEGFGLPLLEAMGEGVPIIASKIPTSYEMAKQNALFFKPLESDTLGHYMKMVIKDDNLKKTMVAHHAETLKKYSWKHCAKETYGLLRS